MNYRHAFHAGNFCDVLKHTVLALCLQYLARKDAPFFVLDTHAGRGRYDLSGDEATRTGEAEAGIGRVFAEYESGVSDGIAGLLAPYLDLVSAINPEGLVSYPGSPEIAARLTRPQDRLIFCELHPDDARVLADNYRADRRIRVEGCDGWQALKALLPQPQRRGLVLIDAAFEKHDEFQRIVTGFQQATRRFASGIYLIWYPIKEQREVARFREALKAAASCPLLRVELEIGQAVAPGRLSATGLIIANPPYMLADDLRFLLPWLKTTMGSGKGSHCLVDWLKPE